MEEEHGKKRSDDNSRIIKNSVILYIRLFFNALLGLFTARFLLQSLGTSDFGLYNVVGSIVVLMSLLNTVMVSTSFRYISLEIGKGCPVSINKVFNTTFVIHIGLAFLIALILEVFGNYYIHNFLNIPANRIADAVFVLRFSTLATIFTILSVPFQALITAHEQFKFRSSVELLSSTLKLVAAFGLFYYLGNRLRLYSVSMTFVMLVAPILFIRYCSKNYISEINWNFHRDKTAYKEMLGYTAWILLGTTATLGKTHCSALIINSFFNLIVNAAFGIATQVNTITMMFAKSLGQAAIPQITKSYGGGNFDRTMELSRYVSKYSFFLILLPALPILLETNFILKLWLGEVPEYTALFCQLMIINATIDSTNTGISATVLATGKVNNFIIITSIISLLSLPLSFLLFNLGYPAYFILIIYIASSIVMIIAQLFILKRLLNFNVTLFVKSSYLRIMYVIICLSPVFFLKNNFHYGATRFITISVVSLIWSFVVIFLVGLEKEERMYLVSIFSKLFNKIIKSRVPCE